MRYRSITRLEPVPRSVRNGVTPAKAGVQSSRVHLDPGLRRDDGYGRAAPEQGFVLPAAIFLIVIMAALGAFVAQITAASQIASAQDVQGARALQAARAGIEAGLYAVQIDGNCPGGTLANLGGLNGFKVSWSCSASAFIEGGEARTIWQITATACTTAGAACPSANTAEMQSADYTERELIVVTER